MWIKITTSLILVTVVGVGCWAIIDKLDSDTFRLITGVLLTLLVVVVVGGLFVGKDLVQAYLIRRAVQQDDMNDLKQMAILSRLMGGNTTIRMPNQRTPTGSNLFMLGQGQQGTTFDGQYRDVTESVEVE